MPFEEALQIKEVPEGSKLEVNVNAFTNKENELRESLQYTLKRAQDELGRMSGYMKTKLNKEELRVANLAIKRELEKNMPPDFMEQYREAKDWGEAVNLITKNILENIQRFATNRLEKVVKIVDDESWTSSLRKDEVEDILKNLDPNITDEQILAFQRQIYGEDLLEEGGKAIAGGRLARIDNAIKEATR